MYATFARMERVAFGLLSSLKAEGQLYLFFFFFHSPVVGVQAGAIRTKTIRTD